MTIKSFLLQPWANPYNFICIFSTCILQIWNIWVIWKCSTFKAKKTQRTGLSPDIRKSQKCAFCLNRMLRLLLLPQSHEKTLKDCVNLEFKKKLETHIVLSHFITLNFLDINFPHFKYVMFLYPFYFSFYHRLQKIDIHFLYK